MYKRIAIAVLSLLCAVTMKAQENIPEDFVTASILFVEPGGALYSRAGHVLLHMQCPEHGLDYVFSYESEDASKKILKYLSGNLKMGLFAIPFDDFPSFYEGEGRGITEYELNLPISIKQNLWRILDNHMMEGNNLPYDFLLRGCAQSALCFIKEAIYPDRITYGPWPESFNLTRRELANIQLESYPWTMTFLNLIVNGDIDDNCSNEQKVIMPADLLAVLKNASFDGHPILKNNVVEVAESSGVPIKTCPFTPLHLSLVILFLTLLCVIFGKNWMRIPLLVLQTALGLLSFYLVVFSPLPCTQWSWLLIPFNPLPLLFWKWKKKWALPYAATCLVWAVVMLLLKHPVTLPCFVVLSLSLVLDYWNTHKETRLHTPE